MNNFSKYFFSRILSWKLSSPKQISTYNMISIGPPPMESSFIGWVSGSSWQQSMVQIIMISGHLERLIVLLVLHEAAQLHVKEVL